MDSPITPSATPANTVATSPLAGVPSEDSGASVLDPDIPRLTLDTFDADLSFPFDMQTSDLDMEDIEDGNERDNEEEYPVKSGISGDDVEASFLQSSKPPCSKTTLVSCLSSRATSPGPLSPLLSEDDVTISSASSTCLSRRSSVCETPRVRFKRGCVITAVNLTWACTSYDRAPIDVAQSLDMKRCHSIDPSGQDVDLDDETSTSRWVQDLERHAAAVPSPPPLASSPCTTSDSASAYASAFGDLSSIQSNDSNSNSSGCGAWEHSPVPALVLDDSSGSDSDESHWLNRCSLDSSFGAAARELTAHEDAILLPDSSLVSPFKSASSALHDDDEDGNVDTPFLHDERREQVVVVNEPSGHRDERDEMPVKKCPRRAIGKFGRDDLYASCDALGGF